jgi:lipopolysaccharide/colanic/teichoic acid biosynthesis glycosyltransferase
MNSSIPSKFSEESQKLPSSQNRIELVEELYRRYESLSARKRLFNHSRYLLKRHSWAIIVGGTKAIKRAADIVVSIGMLVLLSPLLAIAALAVKLTDGGPILFWQMRVGQWGREFPFPKFRSMVLSAEQLKDTLLNANDHGSGITFKMKRDPRVTRVGRILRKFSVDELPQLWCVLCGDMSLVGPIVRLNSMCNISKVRRCCSTSFCC